MSRFSLAVLLTWLVPSSAFSQAKDSIVSVSLIDKSRAYYLRQQKNTMMYGNGLLYAQYTADAGQTFTHLPLDVINELLRKENRITEINISFVDQSVGFVYGYLTGYMYYPFLFRTADGGKTWQHIAGITKANDSKKVTMGAPLRRNDFCMFDQRKGIVLSNWQQQAGEFSYKLTRDGGRTWTPKTFTIDNKKLSISNAKDHLTAFYSHDGSVTVVISYSDYAYPKNSQVEVIRSTDFGETFKVLK